MRSLRKNRMLQGVRISGFFKWKGEVRIKASGWTYAKSQAGKPDLRKADGSAIRPYPLCLAWSNNLQFSRRGDAQSGFSR